MQYSTNDRLFELYLKNLPSGLLENIHLIPKPRVYRHILYYVGTLNAIKIAFVVSNILSNS